MNMPLERGPDGFIRDDHQNSEFLVQRKAFTSEEVLAAEREKIFSTCWLYAAHASEIPEAERFRVPQNWRTRSGGGTGCRRQYWGIF